MEKNALNASGILRNLATKGQGAAQATKGVVSQVGEGAKNVMEYLGKGIKGEGVGKAWDKTRKRSIKDYLAVPGKVMNDNNVLTKMRDYNLSSMASDKIPRGEGGIIDTMMRTHKEVAGKKLTQAAASSLSKNWPKQPTGVERVVKFLKTPEAQRTGVAAATAGAGAAGTGIAIKSLFNKEGSIDPEAVYEYTFEKISKMKGKEAEAEEPEAKKENPFVKKQ